MIKTESILPEETLNAILRTGSNHNRTELRLIYNFMSVQTKEEYEEFVRNEYGNGGKGFIIDGKKYAVWFNKNGMQIALGETVRTKDKIHLSWEQVTNRIHCLLKEGEFAPQSMLDKAQDNAIKEHAQALAYMKGDMAEGVAEIVFAEKDLPHLRSIYPEITDYLENGNIKHSVNYPDCDMGLRGDKTRILVLHHNVPNMIGQFTALLAKDNVNIDDMTNKSRGSYAYTMIDVDNDVTEDVVKGLEMIESVLKVRVIA